MKAFSEIVLIFGVTIAAFLAVFLLNFWIVHHIEILIGAKKHMVHHRSQRFYGSYMDFRNG